MATLAERQRSCLQIGEGSRKFAVTAITPRKGVLQNDQTEASPKEIFLKKPNKKHVIVRFFCLMKQQ